MQAFNQTRSMYRAKRARALFFPLAILAYLTYVAIDFDVAGLAQRAKVENAISLVRDLYSYKTHVTMDNRQGELRIAIEGERKGEYPQGTAPDWVSLGTVNRIDLDEGYWVELEGKTSRFNIPGYGLIETVATRRGIQAQLPPGPLPDWINQSKNRLSVTTPNGRFMATRNKTDVFRYFFGWELFFFTLDSPYHDMDSGELWQRATSGELNAIASDIWRNKMWRHGEVAWAIFETLLMAMLGTIGAAVIALPLAFLAAHNFTPSALARFGIRRIFDFVRGVDGLIWTIVLSRAFGPGPLTGALAMLLTDTGAFGKIFSEALENVDKKQIEGVQSTGAHPIQRYRFGVIPQVIPVLLSQVLYFLESNTRSATVIGAIVGGGIGLLLTQAIITQKDWEEVSYYIVLIVLMVMAMDVFSGWLRRKLIGGGAH